MILSVFLLSHLIFSSNLVQLNSEFIASFDGISCEVACSTQGFVCDEKEYVKILNRLHSFFAITLTFLNFSINT